MTIEKMKWYKVLVDGQSYIVRIDDRIFRYCVLDYYDGRMWTFGTLKKCRDWVNNHLDARKDNNGKTVYMGAWQR